MKSFKALLGLVGFTTAALLLSGCGGRRSSYNDGYSTRGAHVTYEEEGEVEVDRTAEAYGQQPARAQRVARSPRADRPAAPRAESPRRERRSNQARPVRRSKKDNGVQDRSAPSTVVSETQINHNGNGVTKTTVEVEEMGQ